MPSSFTVEELARVSEFMLGKQSINKTTPPDSGSVFPGTFSLTVNTPKGCQSIRGFAGDGLDGVGFETRVSLYSPNYSGSHHVDQAGFEPTDICLLLLS